MSLLAAPLESAEGAVIWLLVSFSVVTWGLALVKDVRFARQKCQDRQFQRQFWSAISLDSAGEQAQGKQGVGVRVVQAGFAATQVQGNSQPDLTQSISHQDRLEHTLRQQIQCERRSLESGLAVLASIGSTSLFIGLFGTVWGIMEALRGINAAGSVNLETVVGPIGNALITTSAGITVAVPAVLIYSYFLRRLKLTAANLDDLTYDFYSLTQKSVFRVIIHPSAARQADSPSCNVKEAS